MKLQDDNKHVKDKIIERNDKIDELNTEIKKLTSKLHNSELRVAQLTSGLAVTKASLKAMEEKKDFLWQKGHEIVKLCQDKDTQITRLKTENEKLKQIQIQSVKN